MKRFILALTLLAVLFTLAPVSAQVGTTTWTAAPTPGIATRDAMKGFPEDPVAFDTVSVKNTATTTAQVVTALAGRKNVRITCISAGAGPEVVWVNVGTTTALTATGIPVTCYASGTTIELPYSTNVALSYISASATVVSVVQEGQNPASNQRR